MDYYCDQKYNFLQSKPYLQKFFARRSEMDNNGKSVSITLSWYQYITFAVVYFPLQSTWYEVQYHQAQNRTPKWVNISFQ